jgi:hypothetical protein
VTTTNNEQAFEDLHKTIEDALEGVRRMNYALALKAILIKMLEECEKAEAKGIDVSEIVTLVRIANDYLLYLEDSPNEVPRV